MNASITLSVITVTRNCSLTLPYTLQSIARIKPLNVEYIVVDGASTDGTLDILRSVGGLIDTLVSEPDSGIYNAMNKAVKLSRGTYVMFINGDDQLITDGFGDVISALESSRANIICATTVVGDRTSPEEVLIAKPLMLLFYNSIPHPSSFVRRELLLDNPFREDLRIVSDYDFFLRAYLSGQKFEILPIVTALHIRGGASGDIDNSIAELDMVRRERLGWVYTVLRYLSVLYRNVKRLYLKFLK
jgi:glycosyltransferase involved in cell wall biosynthesis